MTLDATVALSAGDLHLDVAFTLDAGATVALLGPNGAGKTTLLRALAGLQPLERGRVVLDGQVLEDPAAGVRVPAERRPVGVVFQDYLLFPHLSARDNVAFGLRCRGARRADAARRAQEWLDRVGLGDRQGARPAALSGGQAQRVALARALAVQPRLLLLDEPLSALDATARREVRHELRRRLAAFDGVRVLVTHDPVEALALAGQLLVLEGGRLVQSGTPAEVTAHPRSRYVADLVGVNLYRGRASAGHVELDGGRRLHVAGGPVGDVFAVVHPRAVSLHRRQPEGTPRNVWRGVAEDLDWPRRSGPAGGEGGEGGEGRAGERVRVKVGGALPIVAEVTPAAVGELDLAGGGEVWVSVKAAEVEVYEA